MYDKQYAHQWIKAYEARTDKSRVEHIEPFLCRAITMADDKASILDVGCGWGTAVQWLLPQQKYTGVDPDVHFFPYLREHSSHRDVTLYHDSLPHLHTLAEKTYDLVICSMALHTVPDLHASIARLLSLAKPGGRLAIAEFADANHPDLKRSFKNASIQEPNHYRGEICIDAGELIETDVYFHTESQIQGAFSGFSYRKVPLGQKYVAYYLPR